MNILEVINNVFASWFRGSSWDNWRVFLKALFCLPLSKAEAEVFARYTGGRPVPSEVREAWMAVGRRGGKSLIAALVAVFLACFRDYSTFLGPGERATIMVIAADRRQARVIFRYALGFLESTPLLKELITRKTKESIELSNRVVIEVHTGSFRSVRGYSIAACICDEIAFWRSEESANPDEEILSAIRPGMASIPGALLIALSSPYARRGALWKAYAKHFGQDSPVLVWQAGTRDMNPGIPARIIEAALEEDETAARAEYFAEFRRDIESFVSRETVEACRVPDRHQLPPAEGVDYFGFVDPSGGSQDSFCLGIAHVEKDNRRVLDLVLERRPPFSPEAVSEEFSHTLKAYGVRTVYGDAYAGQWPKEQFRKHGVEYRTSDKPKSAIYAELLPLLNSGKVQLLDNKRLLTQLQGLERRTSRQGKDSIDHAPHSHDDLINAAAGALVGRGSRRIITGIIMY